ncbi:MAG: hypothetical protein AAGA65_04215 [Actinomycetota bacterium]
MADHPESCRCGRVQDPSDNFCPGCGAPTAGGAGHDGGVDRDDFLLIDGTTADRVESTSVAQSGAGPRLLVVGALGLVVLLAGLTLWPKGEATSPEAAAAKAEDIAEAEDAAEAGDAAEADDTARADDTAEADDPAATDDSDDPTQDDSPADARDGAEADEPADPGDQPGATTADQATDDRNAADGVEGEDGSSGPLLGEATGLGLIHVGRDFGRLGLLDLDTGVTHELAARGEPLGLLGSTLVTRASESVNLYPLDALDTAPAVIGGTTGWVDVLSITEDRVWALDGSNLDSGGWTVIGYDRNGEAVEAVDADLAFPFFGWDPRANYVQGEAGGIYRRLGDGFQRVSTGTLAAIGDRLALVRECDEGLSCGMVWYRADDWEQPLDLTAPDVPVQSQVWLVADDRWLLVTSWILGTTNLYDVESGLLVRSLGPGGGGPFENAVALSRDGRWLLDPGTTDAVIVDLDSGTEWPLDGFRAGATLFVDLAAVGFTD